MMSAKFSDFLAPSPLSAFGSDLYYSRNLPNYLHFSMTPPPLPMQTSYLDAPLSPLRARKESQFSLSRSLSPRPDDKRPRNASPDPSSFVPPPRSFGTCLSPPPRTSTTLSTSPPSLCRPTRSSAARCPPRQTLASASSPPASTGGRARRTVCGGGGGGQNQRNSARQRSPILTI